MAAHRVTAAVLALAILGCDDDRRPTTDGGAAVIPWIATRPARPAPPPTAARPCRVDDVRMRLELQGATGNVLGGVVVTNRTRTACSLVGGPTVRAGGADGRAQRLDLEAAGPPRPENPLGPSGAAVRRLRPGQRAAASLLWANWCGPHREPGGGPGPAPDALIVTLPNDGGQRRLAPTRIPRCDIPGRSSLMRISVFTPVVALPAPSTRMPLSASIAPRTVRIEPDDEPRVVAHRGTTLRFSVAQRNTSPRPFRFHHCPAYIVSVSGAPQQAYVLNCRRAATLAPGARAVFAMRLRLPRRMRLGVGILVWELAPDTCRPRHRRRGRQVTGQVPPRPRRAWF